MAKKRTKKSKQQKRQAASDRQRQRRAEQADQAYEAEIEAERQRLAQPNPDMTPGDRVNAIFGEIGHALDKNLFAARGVALLVDYILCGMLSIVPLIVAFNLAGGERMTSLTNLVDVGMGMPAIAGVIAASLAVSFAYYALIPLKLLPGKTPGKYLTHLEIVMLDGSAATLGALAVRWAFTTFVETLLTFASAFVIQFVTLLGADTVGNVYMMVGSAASLVSTWLVWKSLPDRRALHDIVAGTWVYSDARPSAGMKKGKAGRGKARRG